MGGSSDRRFALGWIVASFFMICGGLTMAFAGGAALGYRSELAAYAAFAAGAAVGGFTAGRASPHRSVLEPAIAGAAVVAMVFAFFRATPVGDIAMTLFPDTVTNVTVRLAGIGLGAGLVGAIAGELSIRGPPPAGALRWVWTAMLVATGALAVASTAAGVILFNEAAEAAVRQFFAGELGQRPLLEVERVAVVVAISTVAAALVGGLVTQMAAPRRVLLPAAAGAALSVAGGVIVASLAPVGDRELEATVTVAALAGLAAGVLALVGAVLGRLLGR